MPTEPSYVTLKHAAKHFQVSLSTFRSWVRSGAVPKDSYIRMGSIYRFNLSAVAAALQAPRNEGRARETHNHWRRQ